MNFIENIFNQLHNDRDRQVLREVHDGEFFPADSRELLRLIGHARGWLRRAGVHKGDRCALLANNSIRWAAMDLALMAEGAIVVPLYARQAADELVFIMKDCGALLVCCGDEELRSEIAEHWNDHPPLALFDEIFENEHSVDAPPVTFAPEDPVTIIYTSGTSGEPKGVILTAGNVTFMLGATGSRLDRLMEGHSEPDQVFHYLPFCFAGSWILLLSCLSRNSLLSMSTDLNKLADELKLAAPNYCLNVPALLERIRSAVEGQISQKPAIIRAIYRNGRKAWMNKRERTASGLDGLWLALANSLFFSKIRAKIGPHLKALICGSAPLTKETQLFFMMLGIPVLQVYGLTETTAICTMDDPRGFTPGRVGPAIPGIEMKLGEGDEILVRGPNIFPGYWNRPEATSGAMRDGWFHTGDQGAVDADGNWAIIGRIKNLLILSSGHNIAPEPIEEKLLQEIPGATHVVLQGNGKGFLTAIITGPVEGDQVERAMEKVNSDLPHYKNIRGYVQRIEPLTIESGLLTANGKLKRDAISAEFRDRIEAIYESRKLSV